MRARAVVVAIPFLLALPSFAKEVWIPIAGSVGVFRTDVRIVNPSPTDDAVIAAQFIPVCALNGAQTTCGGGTLSASIVVPKRQMKVLDDIVATTFSGSGLGAIKLTSPEEFVATARIFALTAAGTLGQYEQGLELIDALSKGIVAQLKSNASFRTNAGFVNPHPDQAQVTLVLHDKDNAAARTKSINMPGGSVLGPANIVALFDNSSADLSDSWISFLSTQPIFAYGSVVDNGTTDPTYIPAIDDAGSEPLTTPQPKEVLVDVGPGFTFTPPLVTIKSGDTVTWVFKGFHNTTSDSQSGPEVWASQSMSSGRFSHTFRTIGTFPYFCSLHSSPGANGMNGKVIVAP